MVEKLTFEAFAARYCERQEQEPGPLLDILRAQKAKYAPVGWMLLEAQDMSSSWLGSLVILPYGPNNTFKAPPEGAVSPRGLASDMSTVVAILSAEEVV